MCPVDVQKLMLGLKVFEKQDPVRGAKVQPLPITVDPERNTPEALGSFTKAFHPRLIGLTGSPEAIAEVAKAYGVYFQKSPGATPGTYLVDHSRSSTLYGPEGAPIALVTETGSPKTLPGSLGARCEWARISGKMLHWKSSTAPNGKPCATDVANAASTSLNKDTGELHPTNVACRLLDRRSGQCSDYKHRHAYVPECIRLTPARLKTMDWLPGNLCLCSSRGGTVPDWHYLVCGDREAVHLAGAWVGDGRYRKTMRAIWKIISSKPEAQPVFPAESMYGH